MSADSVSSHIVYNISIFHGMSCKIRHKRKNALDSETIYHDFIIYHTIIQSLHKKTSLNSLHDG